MNARLMQLKVVLPDRIFLQVDDIYTIVVDTPAGSFGLLPRRQDCVSAVSPGILVYVSEEGIEHYIAHDTGVLVKQGHLVAISVRRAFAGTDLGQMHEQLQNRILEQGEMEVARHQLQNQLESSFLRRFAEFRHDG